MKTEGTINIEFHDENSARAAEKALSHEGAIGSRSFSGVKREGKKIRVKIVADDVVAMRATLNAFMREFQVFEGIEKELKEKIENDTHE